MQAENALIGDDENAIGFEAKQDFWKAVDGPFAEMDGHTTRERRDPGFHRGRFRGRGENILGWVQLILDAQVQIPFRLRLAVDVALSVY